MSGLVDYGIINPALGGSLGAGYNESVDRRNALAQQERANKLADLQYQSTVDQVNRQRALQSYQANKDPNAPDYYAGLRMIDPTLAMNEEAKRSEISKTQADTATKQAELKHKQLDWVWQGVGSASTPQDAIAHITQGVKNGHLSLAQGSAEINQLQNMQPADYAKYRLEHLVKTLDAKDQLSSLLPKIRTQDMGGTFANIQDNPLMAGYGLPVAGQTFAKTPTIGEKTGQGNLTLSQQKFEFEKANPGITVQQTEDGTLVGVNNRTGVAMPITMGNAAPVPPSAVPVNNAFSPRLPPTAAPTATQAIPGMRSVLDQTAPATPMATGMSATPTTGTPLRGKGTAMTQDQQKSAMFGASMLQAQNVIQDVAKRGTYKAAVVPGVLEGLVKLAPLGIGDAAANAVESAFRADPTGFVGPNEDQQKLAQAQIAFATAYLRSTSGAAFGPSEVANTIKEFFPLRGEGDAVIKQKEEARNRAVEGMAMGSTKEGRAYMDKYRKPSATNVITHPQFPGFSIGKP